MVYFGGMDFSSQIPNIAQLLREIGGSSYDKLHRQVHGKIPCSVKRAKAIELATCGKIRAADILGLDSHTHT
jgi:hypothetical protein